MRWVGVGVAVLLATLLVGVTAFLVGWARAPEAMVVEQLSAERLSAMQRTDAFFTQYRDAALIVSGDVAEGSGGLVRFATRGRGEVWCEMAAGAPAPPSGTRLTVVTIAARGERLGEQGEGLLLRDCTPVGPVP